VRWAVLVLAALALGGCETTAEKSAKLERAAKLVTHHQQRGLSITHLSTRVSIVTTAVVHSSEGDAAMITLHNNSAAALRDVPIEITVKDASGAAIYSNDVPGLAPGLVSLALLPAHATQLWIDDQVSAAGTPASVSARVGEGAPLSGAIPKLEVQGSHLSDESASGPVLNHSAIAQRELIVNATARRGGKTVAAGRAVLAQAPAGGSSRFELFFIGDPSGAQLLVSAPATTSG
jgi:hypothetical protein